MNSDFSQGGVIVHLLSDYREISLFWLHTDVVKQNNSVSIHLLVKVTIYWFERTDQEAAAQ